MRQLYPRATAGAGLKANCCRLPGMSRHTPPPPQDTIDVVKDLLGKSLQLGARTSSLTADTPLLGAIPEFDSMTVAHVLTSLEETFGVGIDDDEISVDIFMTVGSLAAFVDQKLRR